MYKHHTFPSRFISSLQAWGRDAGSVQSPLVSLIDGFRAREQLQARVGCPTIQIFTKGSPGSNPSFELTLTHVIRLCIGVNCVSCFDG
jgi:hypothetical protein